MRFSTLRTVSLPPAPEAMRWISAAFFPDSCSLNLFHLKFTKQLSLYMGFFVDEGNVERKEAAPRCPPSDR